MPSSGSARLSDLIDSIYEAAAEEAAWPAVLERLRVATGSMDAILHTVSQTKAYAPSCISTFLTSAALAEYQQTWMDQDEFIHQAPEPRLLAPVCSNDLLSDAQYSRSTIFNEWYRRWNVLYYVNSRLLQTADQGVSLTLWRSAGQGPVTGPSLKIFRAIVPHVARAVQLNIAMRKYSAAKEASRTGPPAVAWFLLDPAGRVTDMSGLAEDLVRRDVRFRLVEGRLQVQPDDEIRPASDIIHDGRLRGWLDGAAVRVSSAPLPLQSRTAFRLPGDAASIVTFAIEMDRTAASGEDGAPGLAGRLQAAFGLTPAEADVAIAVGRGQTVKATAAARRVSRETIRTHLKRVFSKTSTGRQTELALLLASIRTPADPA
jgi:DNA-binding CsgD family transcriptional regulator